MMLNISGLSAALVASIDMTANLAYTLGKNLEGIIKDISPEAEAVRFQGFPEIQDIPYNGKPKGDGGSFITGVHMQDGEVMVNVLNVDGNEDLYFVREIRVEFLPQIVQRLQGIQSLQLMMGL